MKLIHSYNYLFYRLYLYAQKSERVLGQAGMPEWIAFFSISLMVFINLGSLLFLLCFLFNLQINLPKLALVCIALIVYAFNYFVFIQANKYLHIAASFKDESRRQFILRTIIVWTYIYFPLFQHTCCCHF